MPSERNPKANRPTRAQQNNYVDFQVEDYVDNPVALARIQARVSQSELALRMGVSQAYISKIERQDKVTAKLLERVTTALRKKGKGQRS
jgi:ribosome-binding protein aMBF1 (putative translation factor)